MTVSNSYRGYGENLSLKVSLNEQYSKLMNLYSNLIARVLSFQHTLGLNDNRNTAYQSLWEIHNQHLEMLILRKKKC